MRNIFLTFYLFIYPLSSFSGCEEIMLRLKRLYQDSRGGFSEINVCKKWPYYKDKYLVLLTSKSDKKDPSIDVIYYNITIFIFDDKNKEIARFYRKNFFYDDAIFTESIVIDTARYQLSPSIRAFGVRFNKRNGSKYNSYTGEFINLFYFKDNAIYQILKQFKADEYRTDFQDNCMGSIKDIARTISIDKKQENGFNNLIVNTLETKLKLEKTVSGDCDDVVDSKTRKKTILRYNGKKYVQ